MSETRQPVLRRFSEIQPRRITWLWDGYLAQGVSGIVGVGGRGKSQLTLYLAAQLTAGTLPGSLEGSPAAVVIASAEDPSEEVVWPRLKAAGADMEHVYELRLKGKHFIKLPDDVAAIETTVQNLKTHYENVVVIVDPFRAHLAGEVDVKQEHEVRAEILSKLETSVQREQYHIVLVDHLNKQSGATSTAQRMIGAGIYNAVRSVVVFGREPETGAHDMQRAMAQGKANWAAMKPTLLFDVEQKSFYDGGNQYTAPFLVLRGETTEFGDEDIIEADSPKPRGNRKLSKRDEAGLLIHAYLSAGGGRAPTKLMRDYVMERVGCSLDTVKRAEADLATKHTQDDAGGHWTEMAIIPIPDVDMTGKEEVKF